MARPRPIQVERLLTVAEVAELLGTTERFPGVCSLSGVSGSSASVAMFASRSRLSGTSSALGWSSPCILPGEGGLPDGWQAALWQSPAAAVWAVSGSLPGA